jgi:hypothetical protein
MSAENELYDLCTIALYGPIGGVLNQYEYLLSLRL